MIYLALIVAFMAAAGLFRLAPWRTRAGWVVLGATAALMAIFTIANYHLFAGAPASDADPSLANFDARRTWLTACQLCGDDVGTLYYRAKDYGYGALVAALWHITGRSLAWPLAVNVFATLATVILAGGLASRTLRRTDAPLAMALTASVCYLTASGCLLIKDPLVICATGALAYAALALSQRSRSPLVIVGALLAAVVLAVVRVHMLLPVALLFVLLAPWRSGWQAAIRCVVPAAVCLLLAGAAIGVYSYFEGLNVVDPEATLQDDWILYEPSRTPAEEAVRAEAYQLPVLFKSMPLWQRLALMPPCAAVQALLPLPWGATHRLAMGYSQLLAHFSWPWYALVALLAYFYFGRWWRAPSWPLRAVTLVGLLMWLMPVWGFAGLVSRYGLPAVALMVPGAVYVLRRAPWPRLRRWLTIYAILLLIALVAAYYITHYEI